MTPATSPAPDADRTDGVANEFARLLHDTIGLRVESSLLARLRRCVSDGAAAQGLRPEGYLESVRSSGHAMQNLVNDITVQESGFFRHPEQFDVLGRNLLPRLTTPVRIWSAGCANGQEAYSLAMLLDELGIDGSIIATDLSTDALERTAAAWYSTRETAGVSPARRARYLTPDGTGWRVVGWLRARVTTAQHNLLQPLPMSVRAAQIIFCRNLLIYLTPDHVRAFLARVADAYPEGTPMFLGAAEVLWQTTDRFEVVRVDSTFHYSRRDRPVAAGDGVTRRTLPSAPAYRPVPALELPVRPSSLIAVAGETDALDDTDAVARGLAETGQLATAAGDHRAAVVAFRACAYLRPHDAVAYLHLGLALEAAGDRPAALRAYGAARRALADTDPVVGEAAGEGYSMTELVRLLDQKLGLVPS